MADSLTKKKKKADEINKALDSMDDNMQMAVYIAAKMFLAHEEAKGKIA